MLKINTPEWLDRSVAEHFDAEYDAFPCSVYSVYGQEVRLVDRNADWVEEIRFEHVGFLERRLEWRSRFHENDYVEWIFRRWAINRIEVSSDTRPISELAKRIVELRVEGETAKEVGNSLIDAFAEMMPTSYTKSTESLVIGIRGICRWAVDLSLPGFGFYDVDEIDGSLVVKKRRRESLVALRDPSQGPYTAVEIRLINQVVKSSPRISVRQRALFLLARDWGVRPIQLALLRVDDYKHDELGSYLLIPSVKGIRRSKLRRSPSNMVRRYIAEDTAQAVVAQIEDARRQAHRCISKLSDMPGGIPVGRGIPMPMFPCRERAIERLGRFVIDDAIRDYALHSDAGVISKEFTEMSSLLSIPRFKEDPRSNSREIIEISAYRLRYTKGTSMVIAGHSAEEVAEALDHVGVDSIKHYFRYSTDMHNFVNKTCANNPDVVGAVMRWEGKIVTPEKGAMKSGDMRVASLGICTLGTPCQHNPTISCYACHSFNPFPDANHKASLQAILEFKHSLEQGSTGALRSQLEAEVNGALSLISTIEKLD